MKPLIIWEDRNPVIESYCPSSALPTSIPHKVPRVMKNISVRYTNIFQNKSQGKITQNKNYTQTQDQQNNKIFFMVRNTNVPVILTKKPHHHHILHPIEKRYYSLEGTLLKGITKQHSSTHTSKPPIKHPNGSITAPMSPILFNEERNRTPLLRPIPLQAINKEVSNKEKHEISLQNPQKNRNLIEHDYLEEDRLNRTTNNFTPSKIRKFQKPKKTINPHQLITPSQKAKCVKNVHFLKSNFGFKTHYNNSFLNSKIKSVNVSPKRIGSPDINSRSNLSSRAKDCTPEKIKKMTVIQIPEQIINMSDSPKNQEIQVEMQNDPQVVSLNEMCKNSIKISPLQSRKESLSIVGDLDVSTSTDNSKLLQKKCKVFTLNLDSIGEDSVNPEKPLESLVSDIRKSPRQGRINSKITTNNNTSRSKKNEGNKFQNLPVFNPSNQLTTPGQSKYNLRSISIPPHLRATTANSEKGILRKNHFLNQVKFAKDPNWVHRDYQLRASGKYKNKSSKESLLDYDELNPILCTSPLTPKKIEFYHEVQKSIKLSKW